MGCFPLKVNAVSNATQLVVSKGNKGGQLEIQVFCSSESIQLHIKQLKCIIIGSVWNYWLIL